MSAVIHQETAHNTVALSQTCLADYYCSDYLAMAQRMSDLGVELQTDASLNRSFKQYLAHMGVSEQVMRMTPVQLLQLPMVDFNYKRVDWSQLANELELDTELTAAVQLYCDAIMAVMTNRLADRAYEPGLPEAENVSEQMHGLQSGSLAYRLGMNLSAILAASLHDIARVTHADDQYGHRHHAKEGHALLLPLQLPSYCLDHAFAKWLLYIGCEQYRDHLISPVSRASLAMQADQPGQRFSDVTVRLNQLSGIDQANALHQLMLMRLMLDDFAKVPLALLSGDCSGIMSVAQLQAALETQMAVVLRKSTAEQRMQTLKQIKETMPYWMRVADQCTDMALFDKIKTYL